MPRETSLNRLEKELQKLVGHRCWAITAGKGAGSVMSLDFGRRLARKRPLTNPRLSEVQQRYEGEYALLVECAWRLDSAVEPLSSSDAMTLSELGDVPALQELQGAEVTFVGLDTPGLDLTLRFSKDLSLRMFCTSLDQEEADDNYSFFGPRDVFVVGARSKVRIEPRGGVSVVGPRKLGG